MKTQPRLHLRDPREDIDRTECGRLASEEIDGNANVVWWNDRGGVTVTSAGIDAATCRNCIRIRRVWNWAQAAAAVRGET